VGLIAVAHILSIVCHYMNDLLVANHRRLLGNAFIVVKIFFYMYAVFKTQTGIVFEECREGVVDESRVMAWLTFEVFAFYLNITAMGVFLLLSSFKKFYSIRDRMGLCGDSRKV
jgi:hypothetical protein